MLTTHEYMPSRSCLSSFFFNAPATTEIYTLSLHDALPISCFADVIGLEAGAGEEVRLAAFKIAAPLEAMAARSEEHTSELQSRRDLVCRLLLEKKKR